MTQPTPVGSTNVTVLWVVLTFNDGKISENNNNKIRNTFINASKDNKEKTKLGMRILKFPDQTSPFIGYAFEIKGDVKPNDFTKEIVLQRRVDAFAKFKGKNMNFALTKQIKSVDTDDTSLDDFQERKPTPIWDIDHPGVRVSDMTKQADHTTQQIFNMHEFAFFSGARCSDIMLFSIFIYVIVTNNDITDGGGDYKNEHRPVRRGRNGKLESIHWKY
ncbi:MAG: hypothetical protein LBC74_00815 [Planctomycetaceae bacterium]|nr:hypothetical protein [Planctomycetaceae bacterium]